MSFLATLAAILASVVGAAFSQQLADEMKAWTPWLVNKLVKRAIDALPPEQQARYDEEWRSVVSDIPGQLGKVVFAYGLSAAARKITRDREKQEMYDSAVKHIRDSRSNPKLLDASAIEFMDERLIEILLAAFKDARNRRWLSRQAPDDPVATSLTEQIDTNRFR